MPDDELRPEELSQESGKLTGSDAQEKSADTGEYKTIALRGMYENWFLDYASYVILERAVPEMLDGLKPVQRRILHAMKELDDGRYNKVANIIGHTMKYHPHGDASIGDALVQLGQKDLLIDMQGNWGNILTGDSAAAPRYIEARLSKFANEVVFNPKTTTWKSSYDGRNQEPVNLPVKFPLLLFQGVEGIAVGLSSKIMPHNFNELIDAAIAHLRGEDFELYPDFITGGLVDVTRYNAGLRSGKLRIRAKISQLDKKTLVISEIPFGVNTTTLIDSILKATDRGKIKIRKIDDNTAANVEILIHLAPGVSPDVTIDALYAFTDCEISESPNACVIHQGKPIFTDVKHILRETTQQTVELLRQELQIRLDELDQEWHVSSLEKIFIEHEIYLDIRKSQSYEEALRSIDIGLDPYKSILRRKVTRPDIERLTEIRIKRISAYNTFKAEEHIRDLDSEMEEVKNHLEHLIDYTINYYKQIKKKYGVGRERKTEIRNFDNIEAATVAVANQKLYVNREEGFIGTSLKKDEFVCDCSDIDDLIVFRQNATFVVTKVAEKVFVGEVILHVDIFRRNDERTIYNMVYQDGKNGLAFVKRFAVLGITRDKDYDLSQGKAGSRVLYFTANPNGEAEVLKVNLRPRPNLRKLSFEYDFAALAIKTRSARGNTLSKYIVRNVQQKENGVSTLRARSIWYDDSVMRLNADARGRLLGEFESDDRIIVINASGHFRFYGYDLSTHFDDDMLIMEKYDPDKIITALYIEGKSGQIYLKRFQPEVTERKTTFLGEEPDSKLLAVSLDYLPQLKVIFDGKLNPKAQSPEVINVSEFTEIKNVKAKGRKISNLAISRVNFIEPLPYEPPIPEEQEIDGQEEEREESDKLSSEKKPKADDGTLMLDFED
ncbi:MAG: DNA topoisomerase IV [Bacteroidetes bacterium HGW-Bacteroidetes-22]|nr:MAG: DNA topoisomerase IV [Bacteroidetes bacterium HGW-Bacteroidetes-22]